MKKQNIEDIFSSMEDFSSVPPPELWGQIEEKLDKPKKKKRAILWWSTAACLLLGLLLPSVLHFKSDSGIKNITPDSNVNNSVVIENKKNNDAVAPASIQKNNTDANSIVNKEDAVAKQSSGIKIKNKNSAVAHTEASKTTKNNNTQLNLNTEKNNSKQAVAQEQTIGIAKNNTFDPALKYRTKNSPKTATDKILAEKTFGSDKANRFNSNTQNQLSNSIFGDKTASKNTKNIASNALLPTLNNIQNEVYSKAFDPKKESLQTSKELTNQQIAQNSKTSESSSKIDSVQLAELQNLEKGIATNEEVKKEKKKKTTSNAEKWAVEVFAGLANSESSKNDKTLGYANDSKQGSTYGVKTKYKVAKRWAVGSGFKINELGQSINNIAYVNNNPQSAALLNPAFSYDSNNIIIAPQQIIKNSNYVFVSSSTTNALKMNSIQSDNIQTGNLDQSLRYLEMPLEVSYAVFNKSKTSVSLNTGGFVGKLISNNVALNGNSIGENANANDFVYGSTLSSTVQYRVYKKTNVFAEPAINYYINPLNNQSFNQFQWGLNFGLNFTF